MSEQDQQADEPADEPEAEACAEDSALVRGLRGLARAGAWMGKHVAGAYQAIDPDVQRHLVQLPLLATSLLSKRQVRAEPGPDDGHRPLIFIHGLGGNRGTFQLMAWYFALLGRKRSYRVGFESGLSMGEQALALAEFVDEVLRVNRVQEVDLVAHSMGGLICRLALSEHGLAGKVSALVTMGTPHQGTFPARYANTRSTRDLRPDSDFIRHLSACPPPTDLRLVCLWSKNDLFVLPPESAVLPGAEAVDVTPMTHYSYLLDPEAWKVVRRALESIKSP